VTSRSCSTSSPNLAANRKALLHRRNRRAALEPAGRDQDGGSAWSDPRLSYEPPAKPLGFVGHARPLDQRTLQPNSPSCGTQPAYISLTACVALTRSPAWSRSATTPCALGERHCRRADFSMPLDKTTLHISLDSPEPRQERRVARSSGQRGPTVTTGEPQIRTGTNCPGPFPSRCPDRPQAGQVLSVRPMDPPGGRERWRRPRTACPDRAASPDATAHHHHQRS